MNYWINEKRFVKLIIWIKIFDWIIFFFFFDLLMTSYLESDMSTRFEHRLQ